MMCKNEVLKSVVIVPQVVVLLNGKPITDYTFSSGVLKTTCAQLPSPPFSHLWQILVPSFLPKPLRVVPRMPATPRVHQGDQSCETDGNVAACRTPLDWETPTGKTASVMLELQLSSFFGYGKSEDDSYLGLQVHHSTTAPQEV